MRDNLNAPSILEEIIISSISANARTANQCQCASEHPRVLKVVTGTSQAFFDGVAQVIAADEGRIDECGNTIPLSGKEGESVDCFSIKIDDNGAPFLWVRSILGDELTGLEWDGSSSFSIRRSINLKTIEPKNFFITHHYGLAEVRYSGIFDLAIGRITRWSYIKLDTRRILNRLDQHLFNKKKFFTKQRIDLLKILLDRHLNGKTPVNSIDIMTDLYSIKWMLHPDGDAQYKKVKFYLDSLVKSGEMVVTYDGQYSVSEKALPKIEEYEEDERKHTENVKMQRRMFWLAVIIALLTCVQAGLIKLPTLIDFSGSSLLSD